LSWEGRYASSLLPEFIRINPALTVTCAWSRSSSRGSALKRKSYAEREGNSSEESDGVLDAESSEAEMLDEEVPAPRKATPSKPAASKSKGPQSHANVMEVDDDCLRVDSDDEASTPRSRPARGTATQRAVKYFEISDDDDDDTGRTERTPPKAKSPQKGTVPKPQSKRAKVVLSDDSDNGDEVDDMRSSPKHRGSATKSKKTPKVGDSEESGRADSNVEGSPPRSRSARRSTTKRAVKYSEISDDDEDEDGESPPPKKVTVPKPRTKRAKVVLSDDDDSGDEVDDVSPTPKPQRSATKSKQKAKAAVREDDESSHSNEDEFRLDSEDEVSAPRHRSARSTKKVSYIDNDVDESDMGENEDAIELNSSSDSEEGATKKSTNSGTRKSANTKASNDSDDQTDSQQSGHDAMSMVGVTWCI
jgi:hypothetical protein